MRCGGPVLVTVSPAARMARAQLSKKGAAIVPMQRVKRPPARVGVFGIGLAAYWPQFKGLKARLQKYQRHVEDRLRSFGGEVISAGLVDDAAKARARRRSSRAGRRYE